MNILFNGNLENPEVDISDSASSLREIGNSLFNIDIEIEFMSSQEKSEFYPENLEKLIFRKDITTDKSNLLSILIHQNNLLISGTDVALRKLGQSFLNFFDETCKENEHIHLDYYEGNDLIAPTSCSLTITCRHK
ncbi:hypothetical protein [Synechococcus sp. PCC 7336]|uniref:Imm32 family immunity protein n=1 Tax=Synechococcus sp. PCC 7336 TaxID=195250 RepID=UPI00035C6A74|nr:hypothetical protein [Synechococcus sp. PCC 7336]